MRNDPSSIRRSRALASGGALVVALALTVGIAAGAAGATAPSHGEGGQRCRRECLLATGELLALGQRNPDARAEVTENGQIVDWADSAPQRLTGVDLHATAADQKRGTVVVYGTGDDGGEPALFSLRATLRRSRVVEVELIVAHDGEASLFPPSIPLGDMPYLDDVLPANERTSPREMVAAADAYFDGIERSDGADVPITDDCIRVENGVQMVPRGPFQHCNDLGWFTYIDTVRDRRYPIVDFERGLVFATVVFDIPGGEHNGRVYTPRSMLLAEIFRIEGGKIRHIEATMRDLEFGAPTGW